MDDGRKVLQDPDQIHDKSRMRLQLSGTKTIAGPVPPGPEHNDKYPLGSWINSNVNLSNKEFFWFTAGQLD